jgi:hypothetical protein
MEAGTYFVEARLWRPGDECTTHPLGMRRLPATITFDTSAFPEGEMHLDGFNLSLETISGP